MSLLTCKEFLEGLNDVLDQTAAAEIRQGLEKHINECPNCWVIYDTTRRTLKVYKGMEPQSIPPDVHNRLMAAIEQRCSAKTARTASEDPAGQ